MTLEFWSSVRTLGAAAALLATGLVVPSPVSAQTRLHPVDPDVRSTAVRPAANETVGNPLARQPYITERTRHDVLRRRAEVLSQSPRMAHYSSRINDLRADDDRKVKAFDLQSGPAGGAAAALPGLKRHDDKLQKMVDQAQDLVSR